MNPKETGRKVKLSINGKTIAYATECEIEMNGSNFIKIQNLKIELAEAELNQDFERRQILNEINELART